MAQLSPDVEHAIDRAVAKVRAVLVRLYEDGDVGSVTVDVGKDMIHVKANLVRKEEPFTIDRGYWATKLK